MTLAPWQVPTRGVPVVRDVDLTGVSLPIESSKAWDDPLELVVEEAPGLLKLAIFDARDRRDGQACPVDSNR